MNVTWKLVTEEGQPTEDQNTLWIAFDTEKVISQKTKTYATKGEATPSPLASKLFGFPWVEEISISPQGILVKRQDWVDFDIIADPLKELIAEHFSNSTSGVFEENPEPQPAPAVDEVDLSSLTENEALIVSFLNEHVNPQVASHGGKISFVKLDGQSLHLLMEGGCQGCGMAKVTLKEGVEKSIVENFDFVKEVIDTTDHSSGIRPYL